MYHHIIVEISFVKYFEKPQWGALCLFKIILSNLFWMHYLEIKHFPLQTAVSVSSISKKALPMSRIVCQAKNWIYFYSHSLFLTQSQRTDRYCIDVVFPISVVVNFKWVDGFNVEAVTQVHKELNYCGTS